MAVHAIDSEFDTLPPPRNHNPALVAIAMSGGVDSSTVAAVLQQQGRPIVGLTMQLWNQRRLPELQGDGPTQHRCCSLDDVYDAKRVAQHLNFPHYVVNFEDQFEQRVVRPFVDQYLAGRTPIACTNCNTDVKFEPLLRMARQIGAERLATGHYARIRRNEQTAATNLCAHAMIRKDQSYFLWGLTQEQLSRSEFPLGELTKEEVRELCSRSESSRGRKAREHGACVSCPTATTCSSSRPIRATWASPQRHEGDIVTEDGTVVGRHNGVHNFTIGQRKGLGFATGKPVYVLSIDPEKNRVIVGEDDALRTTSFEVEDVNWISIAEPAAPLRA